MENRRFRVKGILLDLDGTIVDSRRAYLEAVKTAFAEMGHKTVGINMVTEIPKLIEQNLPIDSLLKDIDTQKFLHTYLKAYYKAVVEKTKPMPNISEALRKLAKKAKLGLITMRRVPKEEIVEELKKFGLADYFQVVITALDVQHPKPSLEGLVKCTEKLGVPTCECMVVGDSVVDIRLGKKAGTITVAVLSGIFCSEELKNEKPDLILENVNKLADFLE